MSSAIVAIYRTKLKKQTQRQHKHVPLNSCKVCIAFAICAHLDDDQDRSKSTWKPINYGKSISQFQLDIITSEQIKNKNM